MTHFIRKSWLLILLGIVTLTAVPSITLAQEATPDATEPAPAIERLQRRYQQLQRSSNRAEQRLAQANQLISRLANWIATRQEEGADTAELETALENYKTAVDRTAAYIAAGNTILAEHAGFDDAGQVIDRETAVATVQATAQNFRNGRQTLYPATRQLIQTIRQIRDR